MENPFKFERSLMHTFLTNQELWTKRMESTDSQSLPY